MTSLARRLGMHSPYARGSSAIRGAQRLNDRALPVRAGVIPVIDRW